MKTYIDGEILTAADFNASLAEAVTEGTWAPTLTGFPAAVTDVAQYQRTGKWIRAAMVIRTTAATGTAVWEISLPAAADAVVADRIVGYADCYGTGFQLFHCHLNGNDGTKFRLLARPSSAGPGDPVSNLWALPSGTRLHISLNYKAA